MLRIDLWRLVLDTSLMAPTRCALCDERIERVPVDDHGVRYHRLCYDMRRAVLAREIKREPGPDARDS